ncbi:MAG: hypothetical protein A2534_04410 [Candidatus Magasanikbacteria bacterium RIFOXYD2_FULL_39_9]|uniref:Uncharacterized protein n=1 Tax=Candidatus Magasanikbacteria bacterium RIFOXYD1_FULL_40_23 TaxID=1798705 RepID=A0A1F6PBJ1_9BACT|nr:MAG: hypothetical protein A2534_04410 [Candidatus Magasanikbacteria bacterium RIFOXYD2_FULL_39_9]OGH93430.1 MAG: hypothetical protein A2563_02370 [Candidatus Magasanikbacteria bacterium RIFOXYD1_FULL_40_23]
MVQFSMLIKFVKSQIADSEKSILRCGYAKIIDRRMGKTSFAKRIHRDFYPRFHVYIKTEGDSVVFDLHLDQKRPIYEGVTAHSGEYDGEVIEREAERVKNAIILATTKA